jgi:type IV pilus assembly protein PilB
LSSPAPQKKRRLGEILIDAGLIDELQLKAALSEQKKWGGKLGRTLVEMGFVDEESMVLALSRQLGVPLVDLDKLQLPDNIVQWLRLDIAERYCVFPLGGDMAQKVLHVATADPTNLEMLQELAFHTGMKVHASVAGATAIDKALRRYYYGERMTASETITPQALGVKENTYELHRMPTDPNMNAVRPSRAAAVSSSGPESLRIAELERRIDALNDRIGMLEKHSANQVRALRGLFEVLVEKRVITREEYQAKVRKE